MQLGKWICLYGFSGGFQSIIKKFSPSPITFQVRDYIKFCILQLHTTQVNGNN